MKTLTAYQAPEPLRSVVLQKRVPASQKRLYLRAAGGEKLCDWAFFILDRAVAGGPASLQDFTDEQLDAELDARAERKLAAVVEKMK